MNLPLCVPDEQGLSDGHMTNGEKANELTSQSVLATCLCAFPLIIPFAILGRFEQGMGASCCLAMVLIVARFNWELRKHISFWIAIAVLLLMQLPIVVYVPWSTNRLFNGRGLTPFALIDCLIGFGLMKLAKMAMKKKESNSAADPIQDS
jgi:hypothetical protein